MSKKLIITLEYPPQIGGIATYIKNLAGQFNGDEVVIYAPKMVGDKDFDAKNAWKTLRYNPYWLWIWPRWLRLYFQIKRIVKTEKITEIYVHHALPVGYVAYLIKKFKKISYTLFLHGTDLKMASMPMKRKKFFAVCSGADKVVVNSEFLKHQLLEKFEGLKDVRVVYPCPAENFFQPVDQNIIDSLRAKLALNGKTTIITVARMAEGKGYPHLIRILPKILEKIPNLVWLIIGDGPKKQYLVDLVQKNNLQNIARFLGSVDYDDLPKYYHCAELFVLLTHKDENKEEGWGTAFVEAAACGLPAVAGRVGGVEEAVVNMETGLLVDVYQDQSIISAITNMLQDKETLQVMGAKAKARAEKEFRWSEQLKKIM